MPQRRGSRATLAFAAAATLVGISACADSDSPTGPKPGENEILLTLDGFAPLAQSGATFELWVSFAATRAAARHSTAASAGRFMVDDMGRIVGEDYQPMTFGVDPESELVQTRDGEILWQLAVDAFITLEPEDDPDDGPVLPAIVAGSFQNRSADLDIRTGDAIGRDFSARSGSFHLATPTTSATNDELEGIWFSTPGGSAPSLNLPVLPTGWVYEAWLALNSLGPRSLGRFPSPSGQDSNGWGTVPGDSNGYEFPGSDFPLGVAGQDITAGSVFVTIEPSSNEDGPGPFRLLELMGSPIPESPVADSPVSLTPTGALPTASVTLPSS
ncbi:MAG: hypothetical protein DHS20C21_18250 [Gemmatimonadota bacterium]|nr:MAG: hypothetical protein DHS20C21_18250 [Gemmatimonadota bacterium]